VNRIKKYDTVVLSGQAALRALLTMNGGATIALLTFMGHLLDKDPVSSSLPSAGAFTGAMQFFVYGTFAAVMGYGTIFLTNCFSYVGHRRTGNWMFGATIVFALASLVYFLAATSRAIRGFASP
jgi:type IV secretory pathway VirB2 component (pilin)